MAERELEFHIKGPGAEEMRDELEQLLSDGLNVTPRRRKPTKPPEATTVRTADPFAVAAFILAIPSGVLAILQLAERAEVRRVLERIREWAREKHREDDLRRIRLVSPLGLSRPLDEVDPAEVLDMASETDAGGGIPA